MQQFLVWAGSSSLGLLALWSVATLALMLPAPLYWGIHEWSEMHIRGLESLPQRRIACVARAFVCAAWAFLATAGVWPLMLGLGKFLEPGEPVGMDPKVAAAMAVAAAVGGRALSSRAGVWAFVGAYLMACAVVTPALYGGWNPPCTALGAMAWEFGAWRMRERTRQGN